MSKTDGCPPGRPLANVEDAYFGAYFFAAHDVWEAGDRAAVPHRGRALSVYRVTSHGPAGKPYTVATITRAPRPDHEI